MESNSSLKNQLEAYRRDLQNLLALDAVRDGFLKDSLRGIPELSGLARLFFEDCVRESRSMGAHVDPLAIFGACCFAGAAAARMWNAVGSASLNSRLFALLAGKMGMKHLEETALDLAGMPCGTPERDRFAACVKGRWSITALAAWSGAIKDRPAEESLLFLQATVQALFLLGQAVILAQDELS